MVAAAGAGATGRGVLQRTPSGLDPEAILTAGAVSVVEAGCRPEDIGLGDLVRVDHWPDPELADEWLVVVGWTGRWRPRGGARALQIAVPRDLLAIADDVIDRVVGRHDAAGLAVFEALVRPMMVGMLGRLGELSKTSVSELGAVWPALITMLLRALDGPRRESGDLTAARRAAAMRYIEAHLPDPTLNPDQLAAALHVSRRTLYKVLCPDGAGGTGVAAIIRRERLRRARRMLTDPANAHRAIADLGAEVGLAPAARFSRLFRAEFGESPRDLRTREKMARHAI